MAGTAPGETSLEADLDWLRRFPSRPTGSPAHRQLVDRTAGEFAGLGLEVGRDTHRFLRWHLPDAGHCRLQVGGASVAVASAWSYSGATGPAGRTGRLVLIAHWWDWLRARGAIAVVEVAQVGVPRDLIVSSWEGPAPSTIERHPVLSAALRGPKLKLARWFGALGVVSVWRGLSSNEAAGQYLRFDEAYQDLPALWVAGTDGETVVQAARQGTQATLTLDAALEPDAATDTIWAVSRGQRRLDETILIVSHSDGVNVVEENGHIGLLALARQVAVRPHDRTMIFVLITGHMRIPDVGERRHLGYFGLSGNEQATSAWLVRHPELWKGGAQQARAVGGLVIEHLGARAFADDASGHFGPTGEAEPELLYATTPELNALARRDWQTVSKPGALLHFGEGEPLYERKIPAISLVSLPQYLLAETDGDFIDVQIFRRQIDGFSRLLSDFDKMDPAAFGVVRLPGLLGKIVATGRLLLALMRLNPR